MDAHSGMHQIWGVLKAIMLAPPGSLQMFLGQNMKWRVSPPCMQACPDNHCPSMIGSGVATGVLGIVAFGTSVSVCPPPPSDFGGSPSSGCIPCLGQKST